MARPPLSEEKVQALAEALEGGATLTVAARAVGVSRQALYRAAAGSSRLAAAAAKSVRRPGCKRKPGQAPSGELDAPSTPPSTQPPRDLGALAVSVPAAARRHAEVISVFTSCMRDETAGWAHRLTAAKALQSALGELKAEDVNMIEAIKRAGSNPAALAREILKGAG